MDFCDDNYELPDYSGAPITLILEGDGHAEILEFNPGGGDLIAFDMEELKSFQDIRDRMVEDEGDTVITFDSGWTLRIRDHKPEDFDDGHFTCIGGPICLAAGTRVETDRGSRRVEDIVPGDLLRTLDNGLQTVRQVVRHRSEFAAGDDPARPILIRRGALGPGHPARNLVVSPQHRVLIRHPASGEQILLAACKLTARPGIRRMHGRRTADYINLRCDGHEVIHAEGLPVETLLLTARTAGIVGMAPMARPFQMHPARRIFLKDPTHHPDRVDPRCVPSMPIRAGRVA